MTSNPGITGGGDNEPVHFFFRARDAYNNLQSSGVTDTFDVFVAMESSANPVVAVYNAPQYIANYTVPVYDPGSAEFTVQVRILTHFSSTLALSLAPNV